MSFERIRKQGRWADGTPMVTIYTNGNARFNKAAATKWFDGVDRLELFVDGERQQLGIARGGTGQDSFTLREGDKSGRSATIRSLFVELGLDRDAMDQSVRLPLEHDPDEGLLIADLGPLFEEVA